MSPVSLVQLLVNRRPLLFLPEDSPTHPRLNAYPVSSQVSVQTTITMPFTTLTMSTALSFCASENVLTGNQTSTTRNQPSFISHSQPLIFLVQSSASQNTYGIQSSTSRNYQSAPYMQPSESRNPPSLSHNPLSTSYNPPSSSHNLPSTSCNLPSTSHNPSPKSHNQPSTSHMPPSTFRNPPSSSQNLPISELAVNIS
ncbi:Hypothetical predicted protein [Mytilus galloprovincialis]|uniref:Uncharacterized protein n=1 Tax=Mytilus galloprovincialis TaxID=29158 RepID=A0A8B6HAS6_MYTGA|nr:Hypothetical predicted protein [Mytilus galloprovincialis]